MVCKIHLFIELLSMFYVILPLTTHKNDKAVNLCFLADVSTCKPSSVFSAHARKSWSATSTFTPKNLSKCRKFPGMYFYSRVRWRFAVNCCSILPKQNHTNTTQRHKHTLTFTHPKIISAFITHSCYLPASYPARVVNSLQSKPSPGWVSFFCHVSCHE